MQAFPTRHAETTIDFTVDASASDNAVTEGDRVTFTFSLSTDGATESGTLTVTADDTWTNPVLGTGLFVARGDTMSTAGKDTMIVEIDPEGEPAGTTRITYTFNGGFTEAGETYMGTFSLEAGKADPNASIFFEASAPGNDGPNPEDDIIEILVTIDALATAVEDDPHAGVPQGFRLHAAYPNPFNPETVIPFDVPQGTHVRLEVFNVLGQVVATLVDEERAAGSYRAVFDPAGLPSGPYLARRPVYGDAAHGLAQVSCC